jgi:phosphopantetheinyl transferase (holo-ACP synthase)
MTLVADPPGRVAPGPVADLELVFGVDVVALSRAQQLLERYDEVILRRVATAQEAEWIGTAPARLGAVLGLKEAAIKAMGGRPDPFTWQQISIEACGQPGQRAAEVLGGFAAGLQLAEFTTISCQLHGVSADRVAAQLGAASAPGGSGSVFGAGCFGVRDDHLFAAVCFWKEDDDE